MQIPYAVGNHLSAIETVSSVSGVDGDLSQGNDLHAVLRTETKACGIHLKHRTAYGTLRIFQGKIVVTGRIKLIIADLPTDHNMGQKAVFFKSALQILIDLRDLIYRIHNVSSMQEQQFPRHCLWSIPEDRKEQAGPYRLAVA